MEAGGGPKGDEAFDDTFDRAPRFRLLLLAMRLTMNLLPARYATHAFCFFMSFFMSGVVSLVVSLVNAGWHEQFWFLWAKAWLLSFLIAFPTILAVTPIVKWLVKKVVVAEEDTD